MNEKQALINTNVQQRLCTLECQQQIMTAFFYAAIKTHSAPLELKQQFLEASERIIASSIDKPLDDNWLRQSIGYRDMLLQWIDRSVPVTS